MDWSQYLYLGAMGAAFLLGRPHPIIMAALVGNLLATMLLAADPVSVAVADVTAAAVLLVAGTRRAYVIAALFVLMQPIYFAAWLYSWPNWITYTCIDLIAYLQLAVAGGMDRPLAAWRADRRGRAADIRPLASGGVAMAARNSAADRR